VARLLRWWLYLLAPAALGLINGDYLWAVDAAVHVLLAVGLAASRPK
jgi:hypothetical protein